MKNTIITSVVYVFILLNNIYRDLCVKLTVGRIPPPARLTSEYI